MSIPSATTSLGIDIGEQVVLLAGRSNPHLAQHISDTIKIPLCRCDIDTFSNTEIRTTICQNIRNRHIFIIQTGTCSHIHGCSVNDYLMETLILTDACKRSMAKSINLIMPCYPYARQDKKEESREPITAKLVANLLTAAGITRLIVMDLHAAQIQGFFDIPVDNVYSLPLVMNYLTHTLFRDMNLLQKQKKYIVISPDAGATKRTLKFAKSMKLDTIIMHKQRNYSKPNTIDKTVIIGEVESLHNRTALIFDDMIDTAGTLIKVVEELGKHQVNEVICLATHGILSPPALTRINACELLTHVIVTDSIAQEHHQMECSKLEIIPTGTLFSEVILHILSGESLAQLFDTKHHRNCLTMI